MHEEQVQELLCQALETERGGVEVYRTALRCVLNEELKEEWEEYLEHVPKPVDPASSPRSSQASPGLDDRRPSVRMDGTRPSAVGSGPRERP